MSMKRVVNGLLYDTDTSHLIAEGLSRDYWGRSAWQGSLYITPRSRRWFVVGHGDPDSIFSGIPNNEGIVPVDSKFVVDMLEYVEEDVFNILLKYKSDLGIRDADEVPIGTVGC
jgi:hypothetical protein